MCTEIANTYSPARYPYSCRAGIAHVWYNVHHVQPPCPVLRNQVAGAPDLVDRVLVSAMMEIKTRRSRVWAVVRFSWSFVL